MCLSVGAYNTAMQKRRWESGALLLSNQALEEEIRQRTSKKIRLEKTQAELPETVSYFLQLRFGYYLRCLLLMFLYTFYFRFSLFAIPTTGLQPVSRL